MIVLGILLGLVGTDVNSGAQRFTFGHAAPLGRHRLRCARGRPLRLRRDRRQPRSTARTARSSPSTSSAADADPRGFPPHDAGDPARHGDRQPARHPARRRASIASFFSYSAREEGLALPRTSSGKGAIEGVAGPEAANNAAAQTAFIPTLTLGIPAAPTMALMLGAMIMHNIQPGPQVMTRNPELFWGLIASMWIGNLMLVILNLPLVGIWVRLLRSRTRRSIPAILLFCCIGVYSVADSDLRRLPHRGLRRRRLRLPQARLRAGAADPRLRARPDAGGELPPGDGPVRRAISPSSSASPISLAFLLLGLAILVISGLPSISRRREKLAED